jgi:subfamily B ATP-binding cassette protein HlyB/CyaB
MNTENKEERADQKKTEEAGRLTDAGMTFLLTIAAFYGIPADENQIRHDMALIGRVIDDSDILRIAKRLKLKAKISSVKPEKAAGLTLPAIIKLNDGRYALLAQASEQKFLVLMAGETAPRGLPLEEMSALWSGEMILFIPRLMSRGRGKFGFRWFIPSVLKYKHPLIEVLVAAFLMQILGILSPLVTQSVIDKVLVHHSLTTLDLLAIGLLFLIVFEAVLYIARTYIFNHTASRIDVTLSSKLFDHLLRLPMRYFETRRTGDTIARIRELENIRRFLTGAPMNTILDIMFMAVYIVVMFFYSTKLTLIVLASLPFSALLSLAVTPVLKTRLDEKFDTGAHSQSYLVEMVSGMQTIKSFAGEPQSQKKWEGLLANYTRAGFRVSILSGNASALAQMIQRLSDLLILWFGAKLVIDGFLTVGEMIAFRMLASRVSGPVMRMVQLWQEFQQASLSVRRIGDIFNAPTEPVTGGNKTALPDIRGMIEFEHVRFRYIVDHPEVIRDMSFKIIPGTIVGIAGRSGSGKSTLSKLIQRLYIPEVGKIMIDGTDISLADPAWLRRQIGVVLQENYIFNGSIRENIALSNPAAAMESIIRVAQIAGAHDFIMEMSEGYDTMVGEHGTGLSGGQKQRIAIARALLTDPRILIFDEATSALDYESEQIIQKNLRSICRGRTVLLIAHRLSTLKDADAIMVIERGQLVEFGPRSLLIQKKGLFYQMLMRQQEAMLEDAPKLPR